MNQVSIERERESAFGGKKEKCFGGVNVAVAAAKPAVYAPLRVRRRYTSFQLTSNRGESDEPS